MAFKDAFRSSAKKQRLAEKTALEAEIVCLRDVLSKTGETPARLDANASNIDLAREAERLKLKIEIEQQNLKSNEKALNDKLSAQTDSTQAFNLGIADNEQEIIAFWRETEREDLALKREALTLKNETERMESAAKIETAKNYLAFKSLGVTIFGVAVAGIVVIVIIRESTKLVTQSLETLSETLRSPTFTKSAVTIVMAVGAIIIVGSIARAHTVHSNNARSVAEKAIEAQRSLEETRLRIDSSKKPLAVEFYPQTRGTPSHRSAFDKPLQDMTRQFRERYPQTKVS